MTKEQQQWIDNASLEELLRLWRFGRLGDPIFEGDTRAYFSDRLFRLRDADHAAWTAASKAVGWPAR